jgi:hypothetical protein
MTKTKLVLLVLTYILALVVAVPCIVLLIISGAIIYGILKLERMIVLGIDDNELSYVWNKLCDMMSEVIYNLRGEFLKGIGL